MTVLDRVTKAVSMQDKNISAKTILAAFIIVSLLSVAGFWLNVYSVLSIITCMIVLRIVNSYFNNKSVHGAYFAVLLASLLIIFISIPQIFIFLYSEKFLVAPIAGLDLWVFDRFGTFFYGNRKNIDSFFFSSQQRISIASSYQHMAFLLFGLITSWRRLCAPHEDGEKHYSGLLARCIIGSLYFLLLFSYYVLSDVAQASINPGLGNFIRINLFFLLIATLQFNALRVYPR